MYCGGGCQSSSVEERWQIGNDALKIRDVQGFFGCPGLFVLPRDFQNIFLISVNIEQGF